MPPAAPSASWTIDPDDPRAPPAEVWEGMSVAEREGMAAALPSEMPLSEAHPPEGDAHFNAKKETRDVLDGFFKRTGRRVYLACELPIYYPGERLFAPDVMAVLDVDTYERESWVVSKEGKGLDLAIEVLVSGSSRKDLRSNVERYARLGVTEYLVFDRRRLALHFYRLPTPQARAYEPVVPQGGRYASRVLGLELRIEGTRLRFFVGAAPIPDALELVATLERMVDGAEARLAAAEETARVAGEEASAARASVGEEVRLRGEAESRLAEALARIAALEAERRRE